MNPRKEKTLEELLNLIKEKGSSLKFDLDIPDAFKSNKAIIASILEHTYHSLDTEKLSKEALNDREILCMILKKRPWDFEVFPEWAKDDDEIARLAVQYTYSLFEHASPRLRGQRDFIIWAFSHNVSNNSIQHISDESFKNDLEILKLAVKGHSQVFCDVPEKWKSNKELLDIVIEKEIVSCNCFDHFPTELRDDRTLALKAINDDAGCFQFLSERLRDDEELALIAVKKSGQQLEHTSDRLKDNKDLVKIALIEGSWLGYVLAEMSPRLKKDKELALLAMELDSRYMHCLDPQWHSDIDIINVCLKEREYFSGACYKHFDKLFRSDRTITLRMSAGTDFSLEAVPDSLRNDRDIVRNAIKADYRNIEHLPSDLADDQPFLKELFKLNERILSYLPDDKKAQLFSISVNSIEHRGKTIVFRMILEAMVMNHNQHPVKLGFIKINNNIVVSIADFPVFFYENCGQIGSGLTVRYVNNLMISGDFIFFVKCNSERETWTNHLSFRDFKDGCPAPYTNAPQTNTDFLNHEVYLVPESVSSLNYSDLSNCPRIYFGQQNLIPKGIQLFPTEDSYREALTILNQKEVYGVPKFKRVDDSNLEAAGVLPEEVSGAARVFVDGYGFRFLIPNPEGALKALDILKSTSDRDDWTWIRSNLGKLDEFQKKMIIDHFATAEFCDEVKTLCS